MNIEKVRDKNFIYAVNYETIIASLSLTNSQALSLFSTISSSVSLYEPLILHVALYSEVFGVSSTLLIDTYLVVKKEFLALKSNEYIITPLDEWYPYELLKTPLPPPFLYLKGDVSLLKEPLVAITGSVSPTDQGSLVTKEAVRELVRHNIAVVSGLNKGIEGIAHLETLRNKGKAVALLSSPLHEVSYPPHASLQSYIGEEGLLVTPFAPTRRGKRWFVSIQKELLAHIAHSVIISEERDGGGGVKCAIHSLNDHKSTYIFQHTHLDRSLLWPRKVERSPYLKVIKRESIDFTHLIRPVKKNKKKITETEIQLSLFDE